MSPPIGIFQIRIPSLESAQSRWKLSISMSRMHESSPEDSELDQASALCRDSPIFAASDTMAGMAAATSEGGPMRQVSSQKESTDTDGNSEEMVLRTPA
jgi:hypothetical protein